MAKGSKKVKAEQQALQDARKITPVKLARLVFKSLLFAILVAFIMIVLNYFKVPYAGTMWLQFGVMLIVYFIAYPFLMSEFRPRSKPKKN